ncbi:MAG: hypothetical protein IPQ01_03890 [Zoogloea sp.]|jgi:hypothetical protein|nr:hypothetical protein [Zoogloea sp.]
MDANQASHARSATFELTSNGLKRLMKKARQKAPPSSCRFIAVVLYPLSVSTIPSVVQL